MFEDTELQIDSASNTVVDPEELPSPFLCALKSKIKDGDEYTVLIVGYIGNGKSVLYNTLNGYEKGSKHFSAEGGQESKTKGYVISTYKFGKSKISVVDLEGIQESKEYATLKHMLKFINNSDYKNPLMLWCHKASSKFPDHSAHLYVRFKQLMPVLVIRTHALEQFKYIDDMDKKFGKWWCAILARGSIISGNITIPSMGMEIFVEKSIALSEIAKSFFSDYRKMSRYKIFLAGVVIFAAAASAFGICVVTPPLVDSAILCHLEATMIFLICKNFAEFQTEVTRKHVVETIVGAVIPPVLISSILHKTPIMFHITKFLPGIGHYLNCTVATIVTITLGIITTRAIMKYRHVRILLEQTVLESLAQEFKALYATVHSWFKSTTGKGEIKSSAEIWQVVDKVEQQLEQADQANQANTQVTQPHESIACRICAKPVFGSNECGHTLCIECYHAAKLVPHACPICEGRERLTR